MSPHFPADAADPFDPDRTDEQAADEAARQAREIAAAHDPLGLDLAAQVAHATQQGPVGVTLPPPRGVRKDGSRRRRRREPGEPLQFSGSGPDRRDPQPLGAALGRVMAERGWQREINVRLLLDRWSALVGATNAEHSRPEAYVDKVLTIRAESSVWATSLRTIAPSLVAKLNAQLGDGTVLRVVVVGPNAPSWKRGPRAVRGGRGPRDTYG